eukprot:TRINITY_DN74732_c0_g1_i1.p1 TRINITY_DN74732_c0_g1~~TRINITY_DN74732_c0_g1_i1.p1  ORF type:complete len:858 (-),score=226.29 TRINITY_DN74732_c0_g1_i1:114-2687(-)
MGTYGMSKKKLKHKKKQESRVSPKAKEKAKKAKQIEGGKKLRDSKRAAAVATGKADKDPELKGINSVDELFASDLFTDRPEDEDKDADDVDDESSAGGFRDVDVDDGDDGADDLDQDFEAELGDDGPVSHEKELEAIRKSDPAFYQFLVENDKQLLNFKDTVEEDEPAEADGEDADQEAAPVPASSARFVTVDRVKKIQENAKTSFTAFKALLTAYHSAIRSIESGGAGASMGQQDADDDEEDGPRAKRGNKSKRRRQKVKESLMHISDEATFSEIIEWTVGNIVELLQTYGGELKADGSKRGSGKSKKDSEAGKEEKAVLDPTKYERWTRVKVLASIFWDETYFLMTHLTAPEMIEFLLRNISSQQALAWLWPFKNVRKRFFNKCCSLWSGHSSHNVRLLAFLFLRNAAAMSTVAPVEDKKFKKDQTELELIIRGVLKAFADAAGTGYSWRSVSTFRFMENCYLELLRIDDATTYRVGYVCIRQLALILRNACLAGADGSKTSAKKKALHVQQVQNLVGWPFVRAVSLWTKAIGSLPCLRPLAYPLTTIVTGAMKSRLNSLQYFPFVYQCVRCLNRLSASLEVFVPVSSHLLRIFSTLLPAMDKAHKERKAAKGVDSAPAKAPELDILLKYTEGQSGEIMVLDAVGSNLCMLMTDHLGILSRSPAFPEVSAPVLFHLRKHSKHCKSEGLRRQLKTLIEHAERTAQAVTAKREALTDVTSWKKFFVFDVDTPMGKARADALARKEREEKSRIEAEGEGEKKMEKKKKESKGEKPQKMELDDVDSEEEEVEEAGQQEEKPAKNKKSRADRRKAQRDAEKKRKVAKEAADKESEAALKKSKPNVDTIEPMGFSESDDED